ncbi:unnamed protein product [Effrenium voratum]|nr:unnamed protein product [Effrenium voratum]
MATAIDAWMQHPTKRFMTDPMFTSLLRWNRLDPVQFQDEKHPIYTPEFSLASMDGAKVEAGLVCAWYGPEGPLISNEEVRQLCALHPGRFLGVASGDIRDPVRCVAGIRQYVLQQGFVAVRILPWLWERYADDRLFYPIYAACVELGVPLCLQVGHTGPLRPSDSGRPIPHLERVLLDFPELTVVGGHIGAPWLEEMLFLAGKFPNFYIDTSAYVPERYPAALVEYMRGRGAKRVLYGSNYPMLQHQQIYQQLDKLKLSDETLALFLRGNAQRVFKLPQKIKRIHEYKRQLMNILFVIHRYLELKSKSPSERQSYQKRVVLIGGKAASAYVNAKIIIKLISNVSKVINADPDTAPYLKCAFVPNYCVSAAQMMIPASDISEHISTAGTEASGTSNMKLPGGIGDAMPTSDEEGSVVRARGTGPFFSFFFSISKMWASGDAAEFRRLLGAAGLDREAERLGQLLSAWRRNSQLCCQLCAQCLADASAAPAARQLAAVMLKNHWRELAAWPGDTDAYFFRQACLAALDPSAGARGTPRHVARAAAAAAAELAALGQSPELAPTLQRTSCGQLCARCRESSRMPPTRQRRSSNCLAAMSCRMRL